MAISVGKFTGLDYWTGLLDSIYPQNLVSCTVTTTKSYCQSYSAHHWGIRTFILYSATCL